jgi:CDP-diacylglycerol--glycerol-3-phosphate 3-phosphatidyltransferase
MPLLAILIFMNFRGPAIWVLIIAGLTDVVDGWYARKYQQETPFGKLMDPVADKVMLLVLIVFLVARSSEPLNPWVGTLLLAREFLVTGLRAMAASYGLVLGAGGMGKTKALLQNIGLGCAIGGDTTLPPIPGELLGQILLWSSVVLSYWSMADYVKTVYQKLKDEL